VNRSPTDDAGRLTHEDCLRKAEEARTKAAAAITPESGQQYREIAEMWEALCESMKRNGLSGIPKL
jgi:hypothetical protein